MVFGVQSLLAKWRKQQAVAHGWVCHLYRSGGDGTVPARDWKSYVYMGKWNTYMYIDNQMLLIVHGVGIKLYCQDSCTSSRCWLMVSRTYNHGLHHGFRLSKPAPHTQPLHALFDITSYGPPIRRTPWMEGVGAIKP